MPVKTPCPYLLPDGLREVYERESSSQIAARLGVSKDIVLRWIKEADIPRRVYSPYSFKRLDCPFTAARLRELYWREGKSVKEIAALAAPFLPASYGKTPEQATVTRWLKAAGVTLRTAAESQAVRARLHPETFVPCIAAAQAALDLTPEKRITRPNGLAKKDWRKGVKLAAELKKARRVYETRPCAYCGENVTKMRCLFKHPPERTFCTKSHASRYHVEKRKEKRDARATIG